MAKSVRVIAQETLADGRFRLIRTRAEVEEADGARRVLDYEIYHHGPPPRCCSTTRRAGS